MIQLLFSLLAFMPAVGAPSGRGPVLSADVPAVGQILARYAEALGGEAAARKITSIVMKGALEVPNAGMNGTVEIYCKSPNRRAVRSVLAGFGTMGIRYNGKAGWRETLLGQIQELKGPSLEEIGRNSDMMRDFKLPSLFRELKVEGKQKIEGHETWALALSPRDGRQQKWYFDSQTGLLVRIESVDDDGLPSELNFEDYRDVQSVKFAFTLRQYTPVYILVTRFQSIQVNEPVDDARFEKPAP